MQPRLRHAPIAQNRIGRDVQHLSRLVHAQAAKKSEFHHLALPGMERRQLRQRLIQSDQLVGSLLRYDDGFIQRWLILGEAPDTPFVEIARQIRAREA